MSTGWTGPMFEGAETQFWKSVHDKSGAHYNTYALIDDENGMEALRAFFDDNLAWEFNQVLFSTSGIHGSYSTIEDAEKELKTGVDEDGEPADPMVTFLIIQPRIVCLRYGNCKPQNQDDIKFLKELRRKSNKALSGIGKETK